MTEGLFLPPSSEVVAPVEATPMIVTEVVSAVPDSVGVTIEKPAGETRSARGLSVAEKTAAKIKELFQGKHFTIVREVKLNPNEGMFTTPLGNRGRHGFILVEDGNPENKFIVGMSVLVRASTEYGAVELPAPKRRGRKAADGEVEDVTSKLVSGI